MLKFLRKHNKTLLAIFMCLLMIVFIGGSALESFLSPNPNQVVARSSLGDIGTLDQQQAMGFTRILESLGFSWSRPVAGVEKPIDVVDWILLTREAARFNIQPGTASSKAVFGEAGDDVLRTMSLRINVRPAHILRAMSEFRAIQLMGQAVSSAALPSTAEVRTIAADILQKVKVNAVVIPAEPFVDESATFSDAEIEAQWEPYKDRVKGEGLNFGYFLPHRLTVEFVRVEHEKVVESIGVPNLEKKARKYYDENLSEFRDPAPPPPVEGAEPPSPYLPWEQVKEQAIAAVRKKAASEAAGRIADFIVQAAAEPFLDVPRGEDGYKPAPISITMSGYYDKLIAQMPPAIQFPDAVKSGYTTAFTLETAEEIPGIGEATYQSPTGQILNLGTLAFRNQGVVPKVPEDEGAGRVDFLSLHQTCAYPLTDTKGNVYVFRVNRVLDGRPSVVAGEARDLVIKDLQLLQAMKAAKERAEGLHSYAIDTGLQEAFEYDDVLAELREGPSGAGIGYFTSPMVSRLQLYQLAMGRSADVWAGPGIGNVPQELVNRWFMLEYADDKIRVQEVPDRAVVLVVEWVETHEAREDEFEGIREQVTTQITNQRMRQAVNDWLDPEKIRARNAFELAR